MLCKSVQLSVNEAERLKNVESQKGSPTENKNYDDDAKHSYCLKIQFKCFKLYQVNNQQLLEHNYFYYLHLHFKTIFSQSEATTYVQISPLAFIVKKNFHLVLLSKYDFELRNLKYVASQPTERKFDFLRQ